MKIIILTLLFYLFASISLFSQDDLGPLYVCEGYNCLDIKFKGDVRISIASSNPAISVISIQNQNYKDSTLCFFLKVNQFSQGYATYLYTLTGLNGDSYWDSLIIYPKDVIDIPKTSCTNLQGEIGFCESDEFGVGNNEVKHRFCKGDTTHIKLKPYGITPNGLPSDSMSLDRVSLLNGSIIKMDKYSFDVVWDKVGQECLEFSSGLGGICRGDFYAITVLESDNYVIQSPQDLNDICQGDEVTLYLENTENETIFWNISDGRKINNKSKISLSFPIPGIYTVIAQNTADCRCQRPGTLTINVGNGERPKIECVGMVCMGEDHVYYAAKECGIYNWTVSSQGTILEGGGPKDAYVKVKWNEGAEGAIKLETPGCIANSCSDNIVVNVAIIDTVATIVGPDKICENVSTTYVAPAYEGAYYTWSINGELYSAGYDHLLVLPDYFNYIYTSPVTIKVAYEHCSLGCKGEAQKEVLLLKFNNIKSVESKYCINEFAMFTTKFNENLLWQIQTPSNKIENYTTDTLSFLLDEIGDYIITVFNGKNACNSEDKIVISVLPPPVKADNIIGEDLICVTTVQTYTVANLNPIETVLWTIYDGSLTAVTKTVLTKTLRYKWLTNGPYKLEAQIVNTNTGCKSEAAIKYFQKVQSETVRDTVCYGFTKEYELIDKPKDTILWRIIPDSAGVLNVNNDVAEVFWLRTGLHVLEAVYCNAAFNFETLVMPDDAELSINSNPVCPGILSDVALVVPDGFDINVTDILGNFLTSETQFKLPIGRYKVNGQNRFGCEVQDSFTILERPSISIDLAIDGPLNFCSTQIPSMLFVSNPKSDYTYTWTVGGLVQSTKSSSILINKPGAYMCSVIDNNGCTASDGILIIECCGTTDPIPTLPFNISEDETSCVTKEYEVIAPYKSDIINWTILKGKYIIAKYFDTVKINHKFLTAGYYKVCARGNYFIPLEHFVCGFKDSTNIYEESCIDVIVPHIAGFDVKPTCDVLNYNFTNTSDTIPEVKDLKFIWNFGDPTSGINNESNLRNPSHVFSGFGLFDVTMTLSDSTGCVTTYSAQVNVNDKETISYSVPDFVCKNNLMQCSANSVNPSYRYEWDFGDPQSRGFNKEIGENVGHHYTKAGKFYIVLEVYEGTCLIVQKLDSINVVQNMLSGVITSDISMPKCKTDTVKLTAPTVGTTYLWSTSDKTKNISVLDEGLYTVTITDVYGCIYVTQTYNVINNDLENAIIWGNNPLTGENQILDSISICKGEEFNLECSIYPFVSYQWSSLLGNQQTVSYEYKLWNLAIGRHEVTVELIGARGCKFTTAPFVINVRSLPLSPNIVALKTELCDGKDNTLHITNPNANGVYFWNTLPILELPPDDFVVNAAGKYFVRFKGENGCISSSNSLFVNESPTVPSWLTGCREYCFPKELCLNLNGTSTYQLLKPDGSSDALPSNTTNLMVNEPGDYQIIVTTAKGCTDTTGLLSLTASPVNQQVGGKVFLDNNNNKVYDADIDSLLSGITINLMQGNTIISSYDTDTLGQYLFDSLKLTNLTVSIVKSNLLFNYSEKLDSFLFYNDCIDGKIIDFPIYIECVPEKTMIRDTFCQGDTIVLNGKSYSDTTLDTLILSQALGCDSLVVHDLKMVYNPKLAVSTAATCYNESNGSISISTNIDAQNSYFLDGVIINLTDTIINGLQAGSHSLKVETQQGCSTEMTFDILVTNPPIIDLLTTNSCMDQNNGILTIETNNDVIFAIDNQADYKADKEWAGISMGDHWLFIQDINGCLDSQQFSIDINPMPVVDFSTINTCADDQNGILTIENGTFLLFAINDSINFDGHLLYNNLEAGQYTLFIQDTLGCIYRDYFEIDSFEMPEVLIDITSTCENQSNGKAKLLANQPEVTFSLNSAIDFNNYKTFEGLDEGDYNLYFLSKDGCMDSMTFTILSQTKPDLELETMANCKDGTLGLLNIKAGSPSLTYSIDGTNFTPNNNINDLSAGEFTLYVSDTVGCIYEFPFEIDLVTSPTVSLQSYSSCQFVNTGSVIVNAPTPNILFSMNGIDYGTDNKWEELAPGDYNLWIKDSIGCTTQSSFNIPSFSPLEVVFPPLETDCYIESVDITPDILTSASPVAFSWQDGSQLASIRAKQSGLYKVKISDICDSMSYQWDLDIIDNTDEDNIFAPNILARKSKAGNDCFNITPAIGAVVQSFKINIFDRWGNMMFASENIDDCWYGFFNGSPVELGVYVYIIEMNVLYCNKAAKWKKVGDVTVIE